MTSYDKANESKDTPPDGHTCIPEISMKILQPLFTR